MRVRLAKATHQKAVPIQHRMPVETVTLLRRKRLRRVVTRKRVHRRRLKRLRKGGTATLKMGVAAKSQRKKRPNQRLKSLMMRWMSTTINRKSSQNPRRSQSPSPRMMRWMWMMERSDLNLNPNLNQKSRLAKQQWNLQRRSRRRLIRGLHFMYLLFFTLFILECSKLK